MGHVSLKGFKIVFVGNSISWSAVYFWIIIPKFLLKVIFSIKISEKKITGTEISLFKMSWFHELWHSEMRQRFRIEFNLKFSNIQNGQPNEIHYYYKSLYSIFENTLVITRFQDYSVAENLYVWKHSLKLSC